MTPSATVPAHYPRTLIFADPSLAVFTDTSVLEGDQELHSHDFIETAVVTQGSGQHVTVAGVSPLRRGSAVVVRPGSWHRYEACRGLVVTNCCFGPELFGAELGWLRTDQAVNHLVWSATAVRGQHGVFVGELSTAGLAAWCDAVAGLDRDLRARRPGSRAAVLGGLAVALANLAEIALAPGEAGTSATPDVVVRALAVLDAEVAQPWTVAELAARVHVGGAHLTRLFTRYVGTPPMTYLARLRAERAAVLLCETDRPVAAIAAAVGWPDPNYFARAFRAHYGSSPRAYRVRRAADHGAEHG